MDISTQSMRYVCALADVLNFNKAAALCHTSQPNLSMHIKKVEKELNIGLFERTNKRVMLTSKGKMIVKTFLDILASLKQLEDLRDDQTSQTLHLGIFPTLAPYFLPKCIPKLKTMIPTLAVHISEDKTNVITDQLLRGELDCILVAYPLEDNAQLLHQIVFEDPFYLAVSSKNRLSKKRMISLNDLKEESILLMDEGHCLRDQTLDICHNKFLHVDPNYRSASLETLRAMVSSDWGVTFMPRLCLDENPLIRYILIENPQLKRTIALYWRKSALKSEIIQQFLKVIRTSLVF